MMSSSGTYLYNPAIGDLILNAFARCQIRGPELTAQHLQDAGMECNLLNIQFTNRNPSQWALETPTITLVQGTSTYNLPNRTVAVGLCYLTTTYNGQSAGFDRPLGPISATDYAAIANKTVQAPPSSVWFLLTPVPQITVWPVPDGNATYVLNVQSFRQQQDISIVGGQTLDAPYRFLDAFTAGLAARLARIYAPALYQLRKMDWEEAWQEAIQCDQPDDTLNIGIGTQGYYY